MAFTSFASQFPPAHNGTYVKATTISAANYYPYWATDPAKSLTGTYVSNEWMNNGTGGDRFHIDLGSEKQIDRVYLENMHDTGTPTHNGYYGVKTFTLWGSNEATAFAQLTYATDTDWTQLTCDRTTWNAHVSADQSDPQYALVLTPGSYRYYCLKFADNQSGSGYKAVRRIELQTGS